MQLITIIQAEMAVVHGAVGKIMMVVVVNKIIHHQRPIIIKDQMVDLGMAAGIKTWYDHFRPKMVCYDKYATESIAQKLFHAGVPIEDISGARFYQACGDLLNAITSHKFVHNGQIEFIQQMNNVAAKTNDSGWRIVKRKSAGDISAPISAAMVVHQLVKPLTIPKIISV